MEWRGMKKNLNDGEKTGDLINCTSFFDFGFGYVNEEVSHAKSDLRRKLEKNRHPLDSFCEDWELIHHGGGGGGGGHTSAVVVWQGWKKGSIIHLDV